MPVIDPVDVAIGKRVRASREAVSMTQQGLAERTGVTFQQIQKYERGVNRISAARLLQISAALGVTGAFLLGEGRATGVPGFDRLQSVAVGLSPAMLDALSAVAFAMRGADAAMLAEAS